MSKNLTFRFQRIRTVRINQTERRATCCCHGSNRVAATCHQYR
ncbi:hypothetical protein [Mannheimia haemolytica]|nr:hypothetical protein [Mannheimia haemolytica]